MLPRPLRCRLSCGGAVGRAAVENQRRHVGRGFFLLARATGSAAQSFCGQILARHVITQQTQTSCAPNSSLTLLAAAALILKSIPEIARGAPALVLEKALDSSCSTNNMVRLHADIYAYMWLLCQELTVCADDDLLRRKSWKMSCLWNGLRGSGRGDLARCIVRM